ncbi:MAG: EamA family transporter [Candidatus Aenigmarchaeota archaeon]|nr:EamA family transporter [Candidatus Aenigmarchaeota archaeon]
MLQTWFILALLSAIFFAVKDILAKKWLSKDTNPKQLLIGEYLLLFGILSVFLLNKVNFNSFSELWWLYILKSIVLGGSTLIYFSMLKKYEISSVSPLINLSPLFLLFFSFIFLSEMVTSTQIFGIGLMIASTYFLESTMHHHNKKNPHKAHIKSILSKDRYFFVSTIILLILMSFAAIFDKMIMKTVDVFTNMFFTSIIILGIMVSLNLKHLNIFHKIITLPVFFVATFSIISSFLILSAMATPNSLICLIIPIRRCSTLFSSFFGGLLFHEKHMIRKMVAIIGMVVSLFFIVS